MGIREDEDHSNTKDSKAIEKNITQLKNLFPPAYQVPFRLAVNMTFMYSVSWGYRIQNIMYKSQITWSNYQHILKHCNGS